MPFLLKYTRQKILAILLILPLPNHPETATDLIDLRIKLADLNSLILAVN